MLFEANQLFAAEYQICVPGFGYQIRFLLLNYVNQAYQALDIKFVLSRENKLFAAELCCQQIIRCSLQYYVVHHESGVHCQFVADHTNLVAET